MMLVEESLTVGIEEERKIQKQVSAWIKNKKANYCKLNIYLRTIIFLTASDVSSSDVSEVISI